MVILPRRAWTSLIGRPDLYHILWHDPGAAGTGWAHLVLNRQAFVTPQNKVLANLVQWDCGTYRGAEHDQMHEARNKILSINGPGWADIGTENFELTQRVGGDNLLSPVRLNAVLSWICKSSAGKELLYQQRSMRTNVTPDRLKQFGFEGKWSKSGETKDQFAAMQHAVVWARRLKAASLGRSADVERSGTETKKSQA